MNQGSRPSLSITWKIARNRQTVIEQLVDGLVMGAMLGPGIIIVGRDADRLEFKKNRGVMQSALKRGEILISDAESGETKIECRIWYRATLPMDFLGIYLALLALLLILVEWGSDLRAFVPVVLLIILYLGQLRERKRLKQQLEAYLHNLLYLKAM